LEGESSSLFYVARSLLKLQSLFGTIPNIKAKGALSQVCFRQWWNCAPCQATYVARNFPQLVLDMMLRMKDEDTEKSTQSPEIDTLILLDRRVDMVSPMVTPLTFEALMDETMNIENGALRCICQLPVWPLPTRLCGLAPQHSCKWTQPSSRERQPTKARARKKVQPSDPRRCVCGCGALYVATRPAHGGPVGVRRRWPCR